MKGRLVSLVFFFSYLNIHWPAFSLEFLVYLQKSIFISFIGLVTKWIPFIFFHLYPFLGKPWQIDIYVLFSPHSLLSVRILFKLLQCGQAQSLFYSIPFIELVAMSHETWMTLTFFYFLLSWWLITTFYMILYF